MATISIVTPFGDIEERLEFGLRSLRDMTAFLGSLKDDWVESRKDLFRTQGFGEWPDYLPSERGYVGYKKAVGGGDELLKFNKGAGALRLFKSLTQPNHPDFVFTAGPSSLRVGTLVPYASKHLTGGTTSRWGGVTFPVRNFLKLGTFTDLLGIKLGRYAAEVGEAIAYDRLDMIPRAGQGGPT